MNKWMNDWCFRPRFCTCKAFLWWCFWITHAIIIINSALQLRIYPIFISCSMVKNLTPMTQKSGTNNPEPCTSDPESWTSNPESLSENPQKFPHRHEALKLLDITWNMQISPMRKDKIMLRRDKMIKQKADVYWSREYPVDDLATTIQCSFIRKCRWDISRFNISDQTHQYIFLK